MPHRKESRFLKSFVWRAAAGGSRRGLKIQLQTTTRGQEHHLGDVLAENGADLRECAVESGCQVSHTSSGSERY